MGNSTAPQNTASLPASFSQPGDNAGAGRGLGNNFNAEPIFRDGVVIVGENIAMKIGGYVKTDFIHDFNAIDSPDSFNVTRIPTNGRDFENSRFHARQSRLSFDTRWRTDERLVRTFIEADFFGEGSDGSDAFRLRHAYGTVGQLTMGQTWTTFTDPAAVPQTLDFEGAVSNVNRRQGLIRWTQPILADMLSVAVALENPPVSIEVPSAVLGSPRTETPDFIVRLRAERDWGSFQIAQVVRELGFQPTGQSVRTGTAWGYNFTGSMLVTDRYKFYYQITFGEGIGSYRGSPDVVATGPTTAAILPAMGWMIGTKYQWHDRLTSNVTYSKLSLDDIPGQSPDNVRRTTYLAVNTIFNPYERVFCGVEYLYGVRDDVSGARGDAHRLQMSFGFFLP